MNDTFSGVRSGYFGRYRRLEKRQVDRNGESRTDHPARLRIESHRSQNLECSKRPIAPDGLFSEYGR
ncbi:hypothetical protein EL22_03840 [Halostagnicola sp. A56]|nr:hypothetical protein EL22_03840 [Halostagnicola sp. A56]